MSQTVTRLALGRRFSSVNAYLISTEMGHVLVDSGQSGQRPQLLEALRLQGCAPGSLKLILLTHGDFDHVGSAAYLGRTFGAPIAMHEGDVGMSARGDMFAGRKGGSRVIRKLISLFFHLSAEDRFEPDLLIDESSDLTEYGLPGVRVLLLRAHSAGSIALLLPDGSLLCGDVLENRRQPALGSLMDDVPAARASLERLRTMPVTTVYPGHGSPFDFSEAADIGT